MTSEEEGGERSLWPPPHSPSSASQAVKGEEEGRHRFLLVCSSSPHGRKRENDLFPPPPPPLSSSSILYGSRIRRSQASERESEGGNASSSFCLERTNVAACFPKKRTSIRNGEGGDSVVYTANERRRKETGRSVKGGKNPGDP